MISNVSGQQLINSNMSGAQAQLNIESLSNGVYFVSVTNENGFNKTVKFVKQLSDITVVEPVETHFDKLSDQL